MSDSDCPQAGPHLALVAAHPARTGGMETFCRFLAAGLLERGWRVTVALSGYDIYEDLDAAPRGSPDVRPVDWLDPTLAGDRRCRLSIVRQRRRWFQTVRPDVALFVQSSNTPFRAAIVGAALAGVPVVSTHRTMAWPVPEVPRSRHLLGLIPGLGLHGRRFLARTRLTAVLARAIVYNSQAVRAGYETLYRYPSRKGIVIPNAVQPGPQPPDRPAGASSPATFTIGYVGRISREKRLDVLLKAMAAMETSRPTRLILVGQGPEQQKLAALARQLRVADRITWSGATQDVWSAYRACDVVVLCSPREASSNMILEAMAAGKAVVVTRTGGLPELIDDGRLGLCVPPLDVDALAAALTHLVENEPFRLQLGARARETVLQRHDPHRIADAWDHLLRRAARRRLRCLHGNTLPARPITRTAAAAMEDRAPKPACIQPPAGLGTG